MQIAILKKLKGQERKEAAQMMIETASVFRAL